MAMDIEGNVIHYSMIGRPLSDCPLILSLMPYKPIILGLKMIKFNLRRQKSIEFEG